ncbi:Trihelix transcription factor ASR3 [Bienertia sinuspersici]
MRNTDSGQATESNSGSRCTRSNLQAAAVWSVQDMLILVNEIAAVEGDCQNALSTHQKWTIIAETCTALGVVRNANQCRRKWQSLLADYNLVKTWNLKAAIDCYWSLGCERRKQAGLPLDFDKDLYKAIEDFMKASDRADTDPECDPEAVEGDVLNAEEFGPKPKRQRRRSIRKKRSSEGWKQPVFKVEHVMPEPLIVEDMEHILAAKLMQNTELVHAILAGDFDENVDEDLTNVRDKEEVKIARVRRKADKLVACLGDLAKNLEHFCGVVEKGS